MLCAGQAGRPVSSNLQEHPAPPTPKGPAQHWPGTILHQKKVRNSPLHRNPSVASVLDGCNYSHNSFSKGGKQRKHSLDRAANWGLRGKTPPAHAVLVARRQVNPVATRPGPAAWWPIYSPLGFNELLALEALEGGREGSSWHMAEQGTGEEETGPLPLPAHGQSYQTPRTSTAPR